MGNTLIIAEACDNHLGNLDIAKKMALKSKLAGVDIVKYQHHLPDEEMLPDTPMSDNFDEPLYDFLKKYALTLEQHESLKKYCDSIEIEYLCTPFCLKAAYEIYELGVERFKIGSGEMTDIPTLLRIADLGKPMILSTGMATFEEIDRTYNALIDKKVDLMLMNCISEYPPVYEDVNLGVIKKMQKRYPKALIGHSDHTPDIYTCIGAVAFGVAAIEKHIILDKTQPGPDQSVSIDMFELHQLVDGVKKVEVALGSEKKIHEKEASIREWAFRSLVSTCDIESGEILTQDHIWSKRPGTGIPSWQMDEIIGRKVLNKISKNTLISLEDLDS